MIEPLEFLYYAPFTIELTCGVALFCRRVGDRRPRRVAIGLIIIAAWACAGGVAHVMLADGVQAGIPSVSGFANTLFYPLLVLIILPLARWALAVTWIESLVLIAMGYAAQHTAFALVRAATATATLMPSAWSSLPVELAITTILYIVLWIAIGRRFEIDSAKIRNERARVAISLMVILFVILGNIAIYDLSRAGLLNDLPRMLCHCYDAACSLLALIILTMASNIDRLTNDLVVIRQIDALKARQYEMSRENIELVNTKFHDVRKNLASLRRAIQQLHRTEPNESGTSVDTEPSPAHDAASPPQIPLSAIPLRSIEQMENSIRIYDSIYDTGDDALDTLLTEKSLYCAAHSITLTAMADGAAIAFMERSDVYALFGNILDNAIEATVLLPDPDDRQITFTVTAHGQLLRIEEENYYAGEVRIRDGLPVTTKGDRRFHGFGMRSIAHQVAKYGGEMTIRTDDRVFSISIVMPMPA